MSKRKLTLKNDPKLQEGVMELMRLTARLEGSLKTEGQHEVLMVMEYLRMTLDEMQKRLELKHGVSDLELADAQEDARA